jgi:hypothetical protein
MLAQQDSARFFTSFLNRIRAQGQKFPAKFILWSPFSLAYRDSVFYQPIVQPHRQHRD